MKESTLTGFVRMTESIIIPDFWHTIALGAIWIVLALFGTLISLIVYMWTMAFKDAAKSLTLLRVEVTTFRTEFMDHAKEDERKFERMGDRNNEIMQKIQTLHEDTLKAIGGNHTTN
jgi:uncharacterized membrane protein (DUF106 family)